MSPAAPGRGQQGGFTIIEVLIALVVLLVGMAGILMLQLTSSEATSFSRHATEASVLAEDKMEVLRTSPVFQLVDGDDRVDALGVPDPAAGFYTRQWIIVPGDPTTITVEVLWREKADIDEPPYSIVMRTQRKR
jgi:type IV pilus assembly protein PilV